MDLSKSSKSSKEESFSSSKSSDSSSASTAVTSDDTKESRIAKCIRKVANFSNMKPAFQIDNKAFNPELMNMTIAESSPKLEALFKHIQELDAKDLKKNGKVYKHFIYSDVLASAFGAKLIASAFVAKGFVPVFTPGLGFKDDATLLETKGNNFGLLMSKTIYGKSMAQKFRKQMANKYNERPENTNGELMRFIILDQAFKEGIDLFDVKYVHLFEPLLVRADEKQAIGRATRFCGQKGLEFHPRYAWPLYIFRYDMKFEKSIDNVNTMFELYLKHSNIDLKKIVFAAELENVAIEASVDYKLNKDIHTYKIDQPPPILSGGSLKSVHANIDKNFIKYKYPHVKLENKCEDKPDTSVTFTPTQDFIRNYFTPKTEQKGMLLFHSVGSGKTCTAIATATSSFEKEGYTILWVTRHTLKSDIWKNMFKQICHAKFIEENRKFPAKVGAPMRQLSDNWIEPMSYKQFSNMLLKKNKFYKAITDKNGTSDPLKKTLLIIDEAHKLYTTTGPVAERPRMNIFEEMISKSYKNSGEDSVRVLLMTATPWGEDSMEMVKLLNLLRKDKLDTDFDDFAKSYLDAKGYFTAKGKKEFQDEIAGYISYINRSQDARNFAHPVLESVYVQASNNEERKPTKELDIKIKDITGKMKEQRLIIKEEKAECKDKIKVFRKECLGEFKDKIDAIKAAMKTDKSKCAKGKAGAECVEKLKLKYDTILEKEKEKKKDIVNDCVDKNTKNECEGLAVANEALSTLKADKQGIKSIIDEVRIKNKELNVEVKAMRTELKEFKAEKKALTDKKTNLRKTLKKNPEAIKDIKAINNELKKLAIDYVILKGKAVDNNNIKKLNRVKIFRAVLPDTSVVSMLHKKCKV